MKIIPSTPVIVEYTAEMTREELLFILIAVGRTTGINGGLNDKLYKTLCKAAYGNDKGNAKEELGVEVSGTTLINWKG